MKSATSAKNIWFLILVYSVVSSDLVLAHESEISMRSEIDQCNSLEDDNPSQAIELADKLIFTLNKFNSPIDYGYLLGCMGWAYAVSDQAEQSRETVYELEKIVISLDESEHSVKLLRRAGSIYHRIGDRFSATENYELAMIHADHLGFINEKIPLLVNLGILNSELKDHEKAIGNYYMALDLMKETDDFRYHAPVLFNLAVTLNGQKHFNDAIKIYHQVEGLIDENWAQQRVAQVYFGLAAGYAGINQLQISREYIEKTLIAIAAESEPTVFTYDVNVFNAIIKAKMGETEGSIEVADQAAEYYLNKKHASVINSAENPLNSLAVLYEILNQPVKALAIHKASRLAEEKFQKSFNKLAMAQMQARLSNQDQRKELDVLKNQHNYNQIEINKTAYQKTLMIMAIVFLAIIIVIIWLWQNHSKRQLLKLSIMDPLTQLKNRRGVQYWNSNHKLPTAPLHRYLWLIDIDHFKKINDDLGHDTGDAALQQVSDELKKQVNKHRCVGRWGGEEFIFLTQDLSLSEVKKQAEELLVTLREIELVHGMNKFKLTVSIGISTVKDSSDHMWSRALSQADKALFVAKDRGRNCMAMATDF